MAGIVPIVTSLYGENACKLRYQGHDHQVQTWRFERPWVHTTQHLYWQAPYVHRISTSVLHRYLLEEEVQKPKTYTMHLQW